MAEPVLISDQLVVAFRPLLPISAEPPMLSVPIVRSIEFVARSSVAVSEPMVPATVRFVFVGMAPATVGRSVPPTTAVEPLYELEPFVIVSRPAPPLIRPPPPVVVPPLAL